MEVHPPEHPIHTWRDFFIHIATIVVGLLIAIGLEQTVEAVHRHGELRETRESLRNELEENRKFYDNDVNFYRAVREELEHDLTSLRYIQLHRGARLDDLPYALSFAQRYNPFSQTAWTTAGVDGGRPLLTRAELGSSDELYWELGEANRLNGELSATMVSASRYSLGQPDATQLNPEQLEAEINIVTKAMEDNFRCAAMLIDLGNDHAEVVGSKHVTIDEMLSSYQPPELLKANPTYAAKQAEARREFLRQAPEGYGGLERPVAAEKR